MNRNFFISVLSFVLFCVANTAFAASCPLIGGQVDLNCDGLIQVTVLGDSFVYGTGDTKNRNKGGYVLRAQKAMRTAQFLNRGIPGLSARDLLGDLDDILKDSSTNELRDEIYSSDIVVLDIGRNDRWYRGPALATYRNLKRLVSMVISRSKTSAGYSPYVVMAVLMLPNRGDQGPWVKELNKIILARSTPNRPSDLRFDLVSKRLLSSDQLHPTPKGYDALAGVFTKYLKEVAAKRMKRIQAGTLTAASYLRIRYRHYPTDPSISSSIKRLSSTAYSSGSSLAIGSIKPRTIMALASSSESPRLIR